VKAVRFHEKGKELAVEDVPRPEMRADEALVRVAACGLCHTDLHFIHGVPTFKKPPIILGHEISGTVDETGAAADDSLVGDRVIVPPVYNCGHCQMCRVGRGTLCSNLVFVGSHIDGGFAEYVTVPANVLFRLPKEVPLIEGSLISESLSTPYHAVVSQARLRPGETVAIFGCGGIGMAAVQVAHAVGAHVIAVDLFDEKLEAARRFGAAETLNASDEEDVAKRIRKMTGGGADAALEVVGTPQTIRQAFDSVRWGGRAVAVGYTDKDVTVSGARLMFREIELKGSLGCPLQEFPRIIDMVSRGRLNVEDMVTHRFGLDELGRGFELLERGEPSLIRAVAVL
jgi:6-hydroxycyclohex-1-ene-1-carbonyl-CoA dehydrogenase